MKRRPGIESQALKVPLSLGIYQACGLWASVCRAWQEMWIEIKDTLQSKELLQDDELAVTQPPHQEGPARKTTLALGRPSLKKTSKKVSLQASPCN